MSKLYSLYEELKKEDCKTIYFFKSGIFYIALASDAVYISNKFNLKLTKLNDTICKCGFPASSIDKYVKIFNNNNIDFKIIDTSINLQYLPAEFKINNEIISLLTEITSIDIESLSVSEAYTFIENMHKKAIQIRNNNI